jgi:hypothetical protein
MLIHWENWRQILLAAIDGERIVVVVVVVVIVIVVVAIWFGWLVFLI